MAHRGFHESYKSMRDQIRSTTLQLISKHKADKPSLLVTGISLGGALAALASYDLAVYLRHQQMEVPFIFYTFGQPRIGNKVLINKIDQEIDIIRVVNKADPVPHLPPRKLGLSRFYNPGVQIYLDQEEDLQPDACNGDGQGCSLNRYPVFELCDHLQYPHIDYTASKGCKVDVCTEDDDIDDQAATQEFDTIISNFKDYCQKLCSEGGYTPTCIKNFPPELKCESDDVERMKFTVEDALKATETREDALQKKKNETKEKKSFLCYLPICKKGLLAGAGPSDQQL